MTTDNKKTTVFLDPRALIEEEPEPTPEEIEEQLNQQQAEAAAKFVISALNLLVFKPLLFMFIWNLVVPGLYPTVKAFNYLQSVGIFVMITMLRRTK